MGVLLNIVEHLYVGVIYFYFSRNLLSGKPLVIYYFCLCLIKNVINDIPNKLMEIFTTRRITGNKMLTNIHVCIMLSSQLLRYEYDFGNVISRGQNDKITVFIKAKYN